MCRVCDVYLNIYFVLSDLSNVSRNRMSFTEYEVMIIFVHALPTEAFNVNLYC